MNSFFLPLGILDFEEEIHEDLEYYIEIELREDAEGNIGWVATLFVDDKKLKNITNDLSQKDRSIVLKSIWEHMEDCSDQDPYSI